jgi:hypothetical protein
VVEALPSRQKRAEMAEAALMRTVLAFALIGAAVLLAPKGSQAAPLSLGDHAALSRDASVSLVEEAGRRARAKRYVKRRYDWTYYPYWRPYQYRYWKFYYPYGGPLF